MFEYKIIEIDEDVQYQGTPLQDCFVQEILVKINKNLDAVLPSQFGFFPIASVGGAKRLSLMASALFHAKAQR